MDIFAALVLLVLGGILGLSASTLYHMYDEGWKADEEAKEKVRQRIDSLEHRIEYAYFLIGEQGNRLKKLEPTEVAE
jgi:hypothetical protein